MIRLSSSLTLALVLFFPVFWFVFFGSLCLFILFTDAEDLPIRNAFLFKTCLSLCYLVFGLIIYNTLMKLRRVEMQEGYMFVTNYFKTISFDLHKIKNIRSQKFAGLHLVTIELTSNSYFGKKIRFISDEARFTFLKNIYNQKSDQL